MGASAVRGKTGIVDTTRLLRSSPFGEWVNVFYDPKKTDESAILNLIKKNDCPRARQTKSNAVQNPFVAPGDPIQIKFELKESAKLASTSKLPGNWEIVGNHQFQKGSNLLTIQTPKSAKRGTESIKLEFSNGAKIQATVDVVQQVGKH